jgi:hypothetical protein
MVIICARPASKFAPPRFSLRAEEPVRAKALLLTVASGVQSAVILVAMALLGLVAIRKLGYGHIRRAVASQADIDTQLQLDRLASASDEERLWAELKGAVETFGFCAIRFSLMYRSESDSLSIQREHGDCAGTGSFQGSFEARAYATSVKVEFRAQAEPDPAAVESLKQATESACIRTFGKETEARRAGA